MLFVDPNGNAAVFVSVCDVGIKLVLNVDVLANGFDVKGAVCVDALLLVPNADDEVVLPNVDSAVVVPRSL